LRFSFILSGALIRSPLKLFKREETDFGQARGWSGKAFQEILVDKNLLRALPGAGNGDDSWRRKNSALN